MRHRPPDWPRHLKVKRLKGGKIAYYWELPPWAVKAQKEAQEGDLFRNALRSVPLGPNYSNAIEHAKTYNSILDDYRRFQSVGPDAKTENPSGPKKGTVDWMCEKYFDSFDYMDVSHKQQGEYRKNLALARDFKMKSQSRFGEVPVSQLKRDSAEKLYKLLLKGPSGDRPARAAATMRALSVAWNVVADREPEFFTNKNPFMKMRLPSSAKETKAASLADLERYVAAADALGLPSMGTAAMLAYEGLQREPDLIGNLFWADFHPGHSIAFRHRKTMMVNEVELRPSDDAMGEELPYENLEKRLLAMQRGDDKDLIILRDGTKDAVCQS